MFQSDWRESDHWLRWDLDDTHAAKSSKVLLIEVNYWVFLEQHIHNDLLSRVNKEQGSIKILFKEKKKLNLLVIILKYFYSTYFFHVVTLLVKA